jgi:hypothetical protein
MREGHVDARFRGRFRDEPDELTALVLEALGARADAHEGFVRHRFTRPFDHSIVWSFRYGAAFSGLSVLVIAAGLASSTIAALSSGPIGESAVIALGLVVAVATAVNRLWRPGLRSVLRHRAANALRREGWDFVCLRGAYADTPEEERFGLFFDEIQRINVAAESVDEQPVDGESDGVAHGGAVG